MSFLAYTCTKNVNKELTEKQKSAIIAEIKQQFETSGDGITELDAEKRT
jgi:hypothetical protein